jgi:hypothetical protein
MRARRLVLAAATAIIVAGCASAATPPPSPAPSPSDGPAATTTPEPSTPLATPTSSPSAPDRPPAVLPASLPIRADAASFAVALEPVAGAGLYVALPIETGTVLSLLDVDGEVGQGWPVLLDGARGCEIEADPGDRSVRAVCSVGAVLRAYALDGAGRELSGWPVDLPAGEMPTWWSGSDPVELVREELLVVLRAEDAGSTMLVAVSPDGSVTRGAAVTGVVDGAVIGRDGTAYVVESGDPMRLSAVDLDGVRPGFPVAIDGRASTPVIGPDGSLYLVVDHTEFDDSRSPGSSVIVVTADGAIAAGWPVDIGFDTWTISSEGAGPPLPPVVDQDGSVYVTGWPKADGGVAAVALGSAGEARRGWPYTSDESVHRGSGGVVCGCDPCFAPTWYIETPPTLGPSHALLLAQGDGRIEGENRLVAIRPDGTMLAGWPVTLKNGGSWFAGIAVGEDGTTYGYAVEPAGTRTKSCGETYTVYSGTIVALDGHGDSIYTTTLVLP